MSTGEQPRIRPHQLVGLDEESLSQLKYSLHRKLIAEIDPDRLTSLDDKKLRVLVQEAIGVILASEETASTLTLRQREQLITDIIDDVMGFGPLESLLRDPTISEIMVNSPNEVYIERYGEIIKTDKTFRDDAHIMQVVERIIAPLGRRLDNSSPMVDARVPGGYRLNAIIPPLSLKGPTVTIRKFFDERFGMKELIELGTVTQEVGEFLAACVQSRLNMIISGGTGSGKTTLLNVLSAYIPEGERVITIENPAELRLKQQHVVRLETRPPSIDGRNEVTQRDLVVNALRMRPDRIIVGEVRAGEAFDMLQAMNTGHDGSVCTVHANSPRDAIARIENMVLMAGFDLPVRAIREQLASAIHLFVHLTRLRDGSRKISHITEVAGMEGQMVTIQDIFLLKQHGIDSKGRVMTTLEPTGIRPRFTENFPHLGVMLKSEIFQRPRS